MDKMTTADALFIAHGRARLYNEYGLAIDAQLSATIEQLEERLRVLEVNETRDSAIASAPVA